MRRGQKRLLAVLAGLWVGALTMALFLLLRPIPAQAIVLPTLAVLPTLTPSLTPSTTPSATLTPTFTLTFTPTATETPLPSPTLATRVLVITAALPGIEPPIQPTRFPADVTLLPAPPQPVEPLPDATDSAPPYSGWYSFESDNPAVHYGGAAWLPMLVPEASRGEYHRTDDPRGYASFAFVGEGLRVRYVAARNMGEFTLAVDGQVLDTIDAYAPERSFPGTRVYPLPPGAHVLLIQPTGQKNAQSEGVVVGLDAIQVYRGGGQVVIVPPPAQTALPSATPQIAAVKLMAAPPTVQPTASPLPPREQTVTLVIAYDENGNHAVDPAEGVQDISVRVLDAQTNRVLASGFTDASGFVSLTVTTDAPARLVVPYFGETWELPVGSGSQAANFTLLLAPGNQPGLIP